MTADKEDKRRGIGVDVGLKYEISKTTTEHVPEDVTRRKSDAWLDLIKPVTEWAGLRGDALAFKRKLLRIQQDETLYRLGLRLREKLAAEPGEAKPIPTKALIPFLEKASLEDPDSMLIDAWANLGVSAALDYDIEVIEFLDILARISARERNVLERLVRDADLDRWDTREARAVAGVGFGIYDAQEEARRIIGQAVEAGDQTVFARLRGLLPESYPLVIAQIVQGFATDRANRPDKILEDEFFRENEKGFLLLKRNGLIEEGTAGLSWNPRAGQRPMTIIWYSLTELGFAFVRRVIRR